MNEYELLYWRYLFYAWGQWSRQNTAPKSVKSQLFIQNYSMQKINDDTALLIDRCIIEYGNLGPQENKYKDVFIWFYMYKNNEHEIGARFNLKPKKVFMALQLVEIYIINKIEGTAKW